MTKQKNRKKRWKKSPEYLQRMIKISIFANDKRSIRQKKFNLLNITINMSQETSMQNQELESELITVLTEYILKEKNHYGISPLFYYLKDKSLCGNANINHETSDDEKVRKVWRCFFDIMRDTDICEEIKKYVENSILKFSDKPKTTPTYIESFLEKLFRKLDSVAYNDDFFKKNDNGSLITNLTSRIDCYYNQSDKSKKTYDVLYEAVYIRNIASHKKEKKIERRYEKYLIFKGKAYINGIGMRAYINAFFCGTTIYLLFGELGAGLRINVELKGKENDNLIEIEIQTDDGKTEFSKVKKYNSIHNGDNGEDFRIAIPFKKSLFGNNREIEIDLSAYASLHNDIHEKLRVKRGIFGRTHTLQFSSRNSNVDQKTIEGNNKKDSSKDTNIVSTISASSTNTDNLVKELSKALNAVTGPRICNACGNHVQEDAFDKETLRCFNCVNTALSLIEEGDNYVKASRIKSNDLKDLDSAVESYKDALNYSSKEQKYDVNSKLGHCYFLLQKYSDAINAFVHAGNNPMGLFYLGKCYQEGKGVNKDPEKAFGYFKKAADLGHAESQEFVATQYYEGKDLEQDYKLAFDYFKKAADQGIVNAQYMTGMMCKNGQGQDKNDDNAYVYFLKAADGNNLKAQYELATLLLEGKVVKHDEEGAFKWYLNAADQGLPEAMLKVAQMYRKKSNYEPALEWYRKAVEAKAPNAEKKLLETLVKRAMLAHDFGEFEYELKLYLEAAGLGDENHYRNIADLYYKEEYKGYILKDDEKAKDWYLKAVSKGDVSANIPLGDIYFNKMDLNNAEPCFRKALNAGCIDAKMPLAHLLNKRADIFITNSYTLGKSDLFDNYILEKVIKRKYIIMVSDHFIPSYKESDECALKLYLEAAELGSKDRYNAIGDLFCRSQEGDNKMSAYNRYQLLLSAIDLYRKAAEDSSPYSQYKLAIVLMVFNRKEYLRESIDLLRKACYNKTTNFIQVKEPLKDALDEYGMQLFRDKNKDKHDEGLECLIEAADLGSKKYLYLIAHTIENEIIDKSASSGVPIKYAVVRRLAGNNNKNWEQRWRDTLETAATYGDKNALKRLGKLYEVGFENLYGFRFQKDLNKALDCYRKANANDEFVKLARFVAKKEYENKNHSHAYVLCAEILNRENDSQTLEMLGLLYREGLKTEGMRSLNSAILESQIDQNSILYKKLYKESPGFNGNIEKAKSFFLLKNKEDSDLLTGSFLFLAIAIMLHLLFLDITNTNALHLSLKSVLTEPFRDFLFIVGTFMGFYLSSITISAVLLDKFCPKGGGLWAYWLSYHQALDINIRGRRTLSQKCVGWLYGLLILGIPLFIYFVTSLYFNIKLATIDINLWMFYYSILALPLILLAHFVYPYHSYFRKMLCVEIIYLLSVSLLGTICGSYLRGLFS